MPYSNKCTDLIHFSLSFLDFCFNVSKSSYFLSHVVEVMILTAAVVVKLPKRVLSKVLNTGSGFECQIKKLI